MSSRNIRIEAIGQLFGSEWEETKWVYGVFNRSGDDIRVPLLLIDWKSNNEAMSMFICSEMHFFLLVASWKGLKGLLTQNRTSFMYIYELSTRKGLSSYNSIYWCSKCTLFELEVSQDHSIFGSFNHFSFKKMGKHTFVRQRLENQEIWFTLQNVLASRNEPCREHRILFPKI